MLTVRFLRSRRRMSAGDITDLPDPIAHVLMRRGIVEPVDTVHVEPKPAPKPGRSKRYVKN